MPRQPHHTLSLFLNLATTTRSAAALPSLEYLLITHKRNAKGKGNKRMYGRCSCWRVVACGAPDLRAAGTVSGGTFMLEEMNSREAASFRDCEGLNVD